MGESGLDVKLSEAARKAVGFAIEAKNQEKINIWAAIEQAEENAAKEGLRPALVFRRNRSPVYVVIKWDDFLSLLKSANITREEDEGGTIHR